MRYSFPNLGYHFLEELDFSAYKKLNVALDLSSLESAFKILFLVSGISYYKLYAAKEIDLREVVINRKQAEFLNLFYEKGLSEFIYTNSLDWQLHCPDFSKYVNTKLDDQTDLTDVLPEPEDLPSHQSLDGKLMLAWGGGKDSIVSSLILDKLDMDYDLFVCNLDQIKVNTAKVNGHTLFDVKRTLDSQLFDLNKLDDTYNGHVPITGILAFIKVVASLLGGYKTIVMSNEFSASEASLEYLGKEVNHQYSKSLDFERMISQYIQEFIDVKLNYFSILRPFYELKIARIFSERATKYFESFSSCNRNFHLDKAKTLKSGNFCCKCEKCAFVFLILAAFLPKDTLLDIFGVDLFQDEALRSVYIDLIGLGDKKPLECVGTFGESKAAFLLVQKSRLYLDSILVADMCDMINKDVDLDSFFDLQSECLFSEDLFNLLKNEF